MEGSGCGRTLTANRNDTAPGAGLANAWRMYAFALAFAAIGFVVSMLWLYKQQDRLSIQR
jgi:hypothetical protein